MSYDYRECKTLQVAAKFVSLCWLGNRSHPIQSIHSSDRSIVGWLVRSGATKCL